MSVALPTNPPRQLTLADEAATAALARQLAPALRAGDLLALWGDLGSGKTSFSRALIRCLAGAEEEVPSPTFTLVQTYETSSVPIWHFDFYRIQDPEEVFELGWEQALAEGIVLAEWPLRLGPLLPADRLDLAFGFGTEPESRRVELTGQGRLNARFAELDLETNFE